LPVQNYGVLKGRVHNRVIEYEPSSPHYQIHVVAGGTDYRVAINAKSRDHGNPELLFHVAENFQHVLLNDLETFAEGFHYLKHSSEGGALDYIRGNLFDRKDMVALPHDLPGDENDLNEKMEMYIRRTISNAGAFIYAFGSRWGPEHQPDTVFRFRPGNGIHNVHMNQGNPSGPHQRDNGAYQDGGLLIHYPAQDRWVAIFLAFQSQVWHTNDRSGIPSEALAHFGPANQPSTEEPDYRVRIIAAMVNPPGDDFRRETVTLLNTTAQPVNLRGWRIMDRGKRKMALRGILTPGKPVVIKLSPAINLSNSGGIITLLDPSGLKVDGVHYSKAQAEEQGRTIVF
jgi:uncharacterized protein YukJ